MNKRPYIYRKQKLWIEENIFNNLKTSRASAKKRRRVTKYLYNAIIIEFEMLKEERRNLYIHEGQGLLMDEISTLSSTIFNLAITKRFKGQNDGYGSPDYTSLFLVTQSLIKNFLIYEHIFMLCTSLEDCLIRFQLWSANGSTELPLVGKKDEEIKSHKSHFLTKKTCKTIFKLCELDLNWGRFEESNVKKILACQFQRLKNWSDLLLNSKIDHDIFYAAMKLFHEYNHPSTVPLLQNNLAPMNFVSKELMQLDRVHMCLSIVKIINAQFSLRNTISFQHEYSAPQHLYNFSNESFDNSFDKWIKNVIGDQI